jgi:hypothetical protein
MPSLQPTAAGAMMVPPRLKPGVRRLFVATRLHCA